MHDVVVSGFTQTLGAQKTIQGCFDGKEPGKSTGDEVVADRAAVHASRTGERSSHVRGASSFDATPLSEGTESTSGVSRRKQQPHSNNQQHAVQREKTGRESERRR